MSEWKSVPGETYKILRSLSEKQIDKLIAVMDLMIVTENMDEKGLDREDKLVVIVTEPESKIKKALKDLGYSK